MPTNALVNQQENRPNRLAGNNIPLLQAYLSRVYKRVETAVKTLKQNFIA